MKNNPKISLQNKKYPEGIPFHIIIIRMLLTITKLTVPVILQYIYTQISEHGEYFSSVAGVICLVGCQYVLQIWELVRLQAYKLSVKKQLSLRVIKSYFHKLHNKIEIKQKNYYRINPHMESKKSTLWMKLTRKIPIYIDNYYDSYLCFFFELISIIIISIYLLYKLSYCFILGLILALLILWKTMKESRQITKYSFANVEISYLKINLLQGYLDQIMQMKMCWLDSWILRQLNSIQKDYQFNLRAYKLLDCWCVALWQFTPIGISAIAISLHIILRLSDDSVSPSTLVYLFNMLTFPLNVLSWNLAGIRNAKTAISQLADDILLVNIEDLNNTGDGKNIIEIESNNLVSKHNISLHIPGKNSQTELNFSPIELSCNKVYSVNGPYDQSLLWILCYLSSKSGIQIGYAQQNSWMMPGVFQTLIMKPQISQFQINQQLQELLQLFECGDIPLNHFTSTYSGGEKIRISLARAFYGKKIVFINSNLTSLDQITRKKVTNGIRKLAHKCTIFIKDNISISDGYFTIKQNKQNQNQYQVHFQNHLYIDQIVQFQAPLKVKIKQLTSLSINNSKNYIQSEQNNIVKPSVGISTYLHYYTSIQHIYFLCSLVLVTFLTNYYTYYINLQVDFNKQQQYNHNIRMLILITGTLAIGLFFRSYCFALGNLHESSRISRDINHTVVMSSIEFYNTTKKNKQNFNASSATLNNTVQQLICLCSTDHQSICDSFPFIMNIFFNNLATILASIIIIILEIPLMLFLVLFILGVTHQLNHKYQIANQKLHISIKQQEKNVCKIVTQIETADYYLSIFGKQRIFYDAFSQQLSKSIKLEWKKILLRNWVNIKYRGFMLGFLVIAVYLFLSSHEQNDYALKGGLALLINYIIKLSNYMLNLTFSISQVNTQAISILRAIPYMKMKVQQRQQINKKRLKKVQQNHKNKLFSEPGQKQILSIHNLMFNYPGEGEPILNQFNLKIRKGDKISIRGKSGSGKTTIFKLLTDLYPNNCNISCNVAFSPQHPLILPLSNSLWENINPYSIELNPQVQKRIRNILEHIQKCKHFQKKLQENQKSYERKDQINELSYENKIKINNLRAYIYGYGGLVIYDEPKMIIKIRQDDSYIVVTHEEQWYCDSHLRLENGHLYNII